MTAASSSRRTSSERNPPISAKSRRFAEKSSSECNPRKSRTAGANAAAGGRNSIGEMLYLHWRQRKRRDWGGVPDCGGCEQLWMVLFCTIWAWVLSVREMFLRRKRRRRVAAQICENASSHEEDVVAATSEDRVSNPEEHSRGKNYFRKKDRVCGDRRMGECGTSGVTGGTNGRNVAAGGRRCESDRKKQSVSGEQRKARTRGFSWGKGKALLAFLFAQTTQAFVLVSRVGEISLLGPVDIDPRNNVQPAVSFRFDGVRKWSIYRKRGTASDDPLDGSLVIAKDMGGREFEFHLQGNILSPGLIVYCGD